MDTENDRDSTKRSITAVSPGSFTESPSNKIQIMGDPENDQASPSWFSRDFSKAMANIDKQFISMQASLSDFKLSIQTALDEAIDAKKEALEAKSENKELKLEVIELKRRNAHLESSIAKCQQTCVDLESHSRRDNLIIEGVTEPQGKENISATVMKIFSDMKIDHPENIKLQRVHRLGPKKDHQNRPIIMKFMWYKDRETVWSQKKNLKG